jgi:hypothetical protein
MVSLPNRSYSQCTLPVQQGVQISGVRAAKIRCGRKPCSQERPERGTFGKVMKKIGFVLKALAKGTVG